ncbi:hypothetical protein DICSQDRAFT_172830 [Dichomitus squalens LYAD-421 SS1]|uniref:Uncharacterized protein n=1 Tax=Dichomitus squalens (strain LYAD-421) TaxID=732165 RepID=R7SR31_DICSQ|nr:uncharacterized protein DICSQDRAFT_172830 [Dichomitus squalens LYAD-421 SS1]EJF58634.1 hypothetical protein DICSQDRAFT_172830 [Dichomitus squalens LYAD-421 SS1]
MLLDNSQSMSMLKTVLQVMDHPSHIGSAKFVEGRLITRGILVTSIAQEVLAFLDRELARGDPLRHNDLEIGLEHLDLIDVKAENDGSRVVLVPMLALSLTGI